MPSIGNLNTEILFEQDAVRLKHLPEGIQFVDNRTLCWVNIQNGYQEKHGSICQLNLKTKEFSSLDIPSRPGFVFSTSEKNKFLIGAESSVRLFDYAKNQWISDIFNITDRHPEAIINDACIFEHGLIVGTKDENVERPIAAVYFCSFADGTVIKLLEKQTCSNGKVVTKNGSHSILFDIDSPSQTVMRHLLEIDSSGAKITESNVLIDLTDLDACPDGMCITPDNKSLLIAMYNGSVEQKNGEARQYNIQNGKLERIFICDGAPRVTCPTFYTSNSKIFAAFTTAINGPRHEVAQLLDSAPHSGCILHSPTQYNGPLTIEQYDVRTKALRKVLVN